MQILNLAPWGNVLLQLPPVRLSGAHGWSSLGTSLGDQWLKEVTTNQASTHAHIVQSWDLKREWCWQGMEAAITRSPDAVAGIMSYRAPVHTGPEAAGRM